MLAVSTVWKAMFRFEGAEKEFTAKQYERFADATEQGDQSAISRINKTRDDYIAERVESAITRNSIIIAGEGRKFAKLAFSSKIDAAFISVTSTTHGINVSGDLVYGRQIGGSPAIFDALRQELEVCIPGVNTNIAYREILYEKPAQIVKIRVPIAS